VTGEPPSITVVAHAALGVTIPRDRYGYDGRSHSLWYCDAQHPGRLQWYETAFMLSPLRAETTTRRPFSRTPGTEAAKALWSGMAEFQVAWPFMAITTDTLDEFVGRWAGWFAAAAQNELRMPSQMPERQPHGTWRR
jgi:eukaryotic-like serine/threonine-protein kinase